MLEIIRLTNFRSFDFIELAFQPGINVLLGENGVGKTSILEAMYLQNFTRSFKTTRDNDILRRGAEHFHVETQWREEKYSQAKTHYWKVKNKKKFFLDEEEIPRFTDVLGCFPMIFHSPEDGRITRGTQTERRGYFDKFFSQMSREYLADLIRYRRIVKMKNAYLKQCFEKKMFDYDDQLQIYDKQLIPIMYKIKLFRETTIQYFNDVLEQVYAECFPGGTNGHILFRPSVSGQDKKEFSKTYTQKMEENYIREISMKRCLYGPVQDQYLFFRNDIPMRHFASQGEHKIWLVCLKLAEGAILEHETGREPLYLFDDLFAELDVKNSSRIMETIKEKKQVLITTTDLNDLYRQGMFEKQDQIHVIEIKKSTVID